MYLFKKSGDHEFWANARYPQRMLGVWSNYAGAILCSLLIIALATIPPDSGYITFAIIANALSVAVNTAGIVASEANAYRHRKQARAKREEAAKQKIRERRTNKNSLAYAALESRVHLTTSKSVESDDSMPSVCLDSPEPDQESVLADYFSRAWLIEDSLQGEPDESLRASAIAAIDAHATTLAERLQFIESHRVPNLNESDIDVESNARRFRVQTAIDQSFM